MSNDQRHDVLSVACEAARSAASVLLDHFGRAKVSHKDVTQNLVTQADIESEEVILRKIREVFPDHHVLREEGESTGTVHSEYLWIIDPLDGTNNYAHGIPQFCTAIAYAEAGEVKAGVVLDPIRDELFSATRGGGAFLGDEPIHVSERGNIREAIIATGFYYDRGEMMERTLAAVRRLFQANIRGMRRFGGAALDQCWVACGRFDGFFEYQLSPWDYAASSLIIEEAGGRCADREGRPLSIDSGSVLTSNPALFDTLLELAHWQGTTVL